MRAVAVASAILVSTAILSGCLAEDSTPGLSPPDARGIVSDRSVFVHNALNQMLNLTDVAGLVNLTSIVYSVGQAGPEPSIGVTSNGMIFFQALEKTLRSSDGGRSWVQVRGPFTATGTSDPYLWVDPATDRVFQLNMGGPFGGRGPVPAGLPVGASLSLFCSHLAWSDDYGATWGTNPVACGPVPFNDHEKLTTGPFVGSLAPLSQSPLYPNAVYYAYNKVMSDPVSAPMKPDALGTVDPGLGGWVAVSLDGGQTFPFATKAFDPQCYGSLHGAITAAPDGTVYLPARHCPGPLVAWSTDNGRTWESTVVGAEAGVPQWQKNPEIAADSENHVYLAWTGADNTLYLSTSTDRARTWTDPVRVSPPGVGSTTFPVIVAGDPGRVGLAYLGTEDSNATAWSVANETAWHLYYTYSLDALDANATFVTIRATDDADPVQRGSICINSGACKEGNRNLLDFIDLVVDAEGRPYVAYADGCTTPQCLGADATHLDSRDREGMVMVLQEGPSLYEEPALTRLGPTDG